MRSPFPSVLLFVLLFASFIADRAIATLPLARRGPHRPHRASILVGGALRPERPCAGLRDGQRAPRAGRTAGADEPSRGRRHPQLLGAEPRRQEGPDPGPRVRRSRFAPIGRASTAASAREFCGYQHAHMALVVVADAPADYERWLAVQRAARREPSTAQEQRGRDLVEHASCAMCHTISGTRGAGARARPISRMSEAARRSPPARSRTPPRRARTGSRIRSSYKPGVDMPPLAAAPDGSRRDLRVSRIAAMTAASGSLPSKAGSRRRAHAAEARSETRAVGICATAPAPGSPAAAELERTWTDKPGVIGLLSAERSQDDRPALHRHGVRASSARPA